MIGDTLWFAAGCVFTVSVFAMGMAVGSLALKAKMNEKLASTRRACRRLQQEINELKKAKP